MIACRDEANESIWKSVLIKNFSVYIPNSLYTILHCSREKYLEHGWIEVVFLIIRSSDEQIYYIRKDILMPNLVAFAREFSPYYKMRSQTFF